MGFGKWLCKARRPDNNSVPGGLDAGPRRPDRRLDRLTQPVLLLTGRVGSISCLDCAWIVGISVHAASSAVSAFTKELPLCAAQPQSRKKNKCQVCFCCRSAPVRILQYCKHLLCLLGRLPSPFGSVLLCDCTAAK